MITKSFKKLFFIHIFNIIIFRYSGEHFKLLFMVLKKVQSDRRYWPHLRNCILLGLESFFFIQMGKIIIKKQYITSFLLYLENKTAFDTLFSVF